MSKKQKKEDRSKKGRPPVKTGIHILIPDAAYSTKIENIQAKLGFIFIWIRGQEEPRTMTPGEAAQRALALSEMLQSDVLRPSERRVLQSLYDVVYAAIVAAKTQQANGSDKLTKAVTQALKDSYALTVDDEEMKRLLRLFKERYPVFKEDDIRMRLQAFPGKKDSWYAGLLDEEYEHHLKVLNGKIESKGKDGRKFNQSSEKLKDQ
jgi:hypothetical protein